MKSLILISLFIMCLSETKVVKPLKIADVFSGVKKTIYECVSTSTEASQTLKNLLQEGIIDDSMTLVDHSTIIMDPAYVHINTKTNEKIKELKREFMKYNIYSIGRYGDWTYNSMEDSMIMAKNLADKLVAEGKND